MRGCWSGFQSLASTSLELGRKYSSRSSRSKTQLYVNPGGRYRARTYDLSDVALNFVLNLLFMPSLGVAGLALATAGVYLASAVMLYSYLLVIVPRRIAATQLNSALPACPLEFNP